MNLRDFRLQTQGLSEPKLFKRRVRSIGDPVFDLEAESVGDAVGIRVIGDDFDDVEGVAVAEAGFAQGLDVGVVGCGWGFGEFHGETQHGGALGGQRGGGPVVLDGRYEFVVFDESAETAPVVDYSIVAAVGEADDQGDEFAFDFAQRGSAAHGRFVEALVCCHAAGVQRVDGQDVVDPAPCGVHYPGVQLSEFAVPVVVRNHRDTCHAPPCHNPGWFVIDRSTGANPQHRVRNTRVLTHYRRAVCHYSDIKLDKGRRFQMTTVATLLDHLYEGDVVDTVDLARVSETNPWSVSRWRSEETTPRRKAEERLLELRAVVDLARTVMNDDAARFWLRSPNRDLGYEKPLDLITEGEYRRVVDLLLALAEGVTT